MESVLDTSIEFLKGVGPQRANLLKSELSLGLGYLKDIKEELIEVYQRRNTRKIFHPTKGQRVFQNSPNK